MLTPSSPLPHQWLNRQLCCPTTGGRAQKGRKGTRTGAYLSIQRFLFPHQEKGNERMNWVKGDCCWRGGCMEMKWEWRSYNQPSSRLDTSKESGKDDLKKKKIGAEEQSGFPQFCRMLSQLCKITATVATERSGGKQPLEIHERL